MPKQFHFAGSAMERLEEVRHRFFDVWLRISDGSWEVVECLLESAAAVESAGKLADLGYEDIRLVLRTDVDGQGEYL